MSGLPGLGTSLVERVVVLAHQAHDFAVSNSEHHAARTGSLLETVMVVVGWAIVVLVTAFTIKFLVAPGEHGEDHVKRMVLEEEPAVRS